MDKKKIPLVELYPLIKDKLDSEGEVVFKITGNSMQPFMIHDKTLVTIKKIDKKLEKHDIVFYKINDHFILHRILKIKQNHIITCGDGLTLLEHINISDIFAIVTKFQNGNKVTSVNNIFYKFKVRVWGLLRPIRKYFLYILRKVKKM